MFRDKVQEKTSIIGTGAYSIGSASNAIAGWKTFRQQYADGAQVAFWAVNDDESVWEKVYGTLTYGPPDTLTRNLLLSSTGSLIDWQAGDVVYLYSAPIAEALAGRWDTVGNLFVPAGRKSYAAVGAANKTSVSTYAADAGGRFSFDNSAAARTYTLPALSSVSMGWNVEVYGLSQAYMLNIAPSGSDAVDFGSGGLALPVPGKVPVLIWSDGTQWRTDFDYSTDHILRTVTPNALSSVDFTDFPYWVNALSLTGSILLGSDDVSLVMQTYGADGVLDTGSTDYFYLINSQSETPTNTVTGSGAGNQSIILVLNADNTAGVPISLKLQMADIQIARRATVQFEALYINNGGPIGQVNRGWGQRVANEKITGLRLIASSGTIGNGAGSITLRGRAQ